MVALPRCFRKIQGVSTAMAKARNSMDDKPKSAARWISVYSEVNRGTTFRFYLPRQDGGNFLSKLFQVAKLAQTGRNILDR